MKVYVKNPPMSRAMNRVSAALARYAPPNVQIVPKDKQADVIVLHVIGYPETVESVDWILEDKRNYAIIQYNMRTTQQPETRMWQSIWRESQLVWSYFDLDRMTIDECGQSLPRFYQSPLGIDDVFKRDLYPKDRDYLVMTSGYLAGSECVTEVATAVDGNRMFHLGPKGVAPAHVPFVEGMSDTSLALIYHRSKYVSGLRRCEGFELPCAEGLACGARPIMFDAPHYRQWFGRWATFISECGPDEVIESLRGVFSNDYAPVSDAERKAACDYFHWEPIVNGFWKGLLA